MKKIVVVLLMAIVASVASVHAIEISSPDTESNKTLSNEDIIKICQYLVQTPPSSDPKEAEMWQAAATAIVMYVTDTEEFTLSIGNHLMDVLEVGKSSPESSELMLVELAGETLYMLQHHLKENNAESFASAMEDVMNIYSQLPSKTIKTLNDYLKMDKNQRKAEFIKIYNSNTETISQ